MKKKLFTTTTLLFIAFIMAIPLVPVKATSGPSIGLSVGSAVRGDPFLVTVQVSDVSMFVGYDITLRWDPSALAVQGADLGNTVFDLNKNGFIGDDPVVIPKSEIFQGVGFMRFALVLAAPAVDVPGTASLLTAGFVATGSKPSDFPTALTIENDALTGIISGKCCGPISHTTTGGTFTPTIVPNDIALRSVQCRASIPGFSVNAHGTSEGVFCRVTNSGTNGATESVVAVFNFHSIGGQTGTVVSSPITLAPGQTGELDATITVPASSDVYIVLGTANLASNVLFNGLMLAPGSSNSFKFNVNICTSGNC